MAKRNQVTTDLRISADAQLKSSRGFINQLNKIIDKFDFGDKINNQLTGAIGQLKNYNKVLEKVQNKSVISDDELKDLVKAGKEIANIVSKTEKLYSNLSTNELNKFSKEYIAKIKAQEEAVAKIKNDYAAKTGKNFDKELANYDKLSARVKALEKEKANLVKNGANQIVEKEIDEINKKLEIQKTKLKEIQKLQAASSSAYSSTLEKETKKRGYNSFDDLKGVRAQSEEQIRKRLGNAEYKQQSNLLSEINREIKDIEKSKLESNKADKAAISLAKKYKIENVATLNDLKEQVKLKKDNLNQFKNNKSELANAKQVTVELDRQNKLLEDREAIVNAAKQAELKVIQRSSDYKTKASLTASASATNRQINTLESQLTDTGIEQIANNAANIVANQLNKISGEINKGNQDLAGIDATNKKLATQSERTADEQDITKMKTEIIGGLGKTEGDVNDHTTGDNDRIANNIIKLGISSQIPYGREIKNTATTVAAPDDDSFEQLSIDLQSYDRVSDRLENVINEIKIGTGSVEEARIAAEEFGKVFDSIVNITLDNFQKLEDELNKELQAGTITERDYEDRMEEIVNKKSNFNRFQMTAGNRLDSIEQVLNPENIIDPEILGGMTEQTDKAAKSIAKAAEQSQYLGSTFDDLKNKVGYFLSMNYVFDQMTRKIKEATDFTKNLDKDMVQIGLVLGQTANKTWKNFDTYAKMANRLNTTVSDVTGAMKLFYQQGLNTSEVNKMVEASAIAAALGESSMAEASETLTSIINSYNLSATQAIAVTDKISMVAMVSAADFGELSTAIEKVAASAASAGLDLDHMMGYLAKMIETTREAPTNIGTALKTIVANFTQFKEDPSGLTEEGTEINKVDKALKSVNISLTDSTGEVRDLSNVLDELGGKWNSLTRNQKSYLATQIAGTRQQSRFYALMNDYDRTLELVKESMNSSGKATSQFSLYQTSLTASTERLNNEWEIFYNNILKNDNALKFLNNGLSSLLKVANQLGPVLTTLIGGGLLKGARELWVYLSKTREEVLATNQALLSSEKIAAIAISPNKNTNIFENYSFTKKKNNNFAKKPINDLGSTIANSIFDKKGGKEQLTLLEDMKKTLNALNDSDIEFLNNNENLVENLVGQEEVTKVLNGTISTTAKERAANAVAAQAENVSHIASASVKWAEVAAQLALNAAIMLGVAAIGAIIGGVIAWANAEHEHTVQAQEAAKQAKEDYIQLEELAEKYLDVSSRINRTTEEKEELEQVTQDLLDQYPELISYIDSEGKAYAKTAQEIKNYMKTKQTDSIASEKNAAIKMLNDSKYKTNAMWDVWLTNGIVKEDDDKMYGEIQKEARDNLFTAFQNMEDAGLKGTTFSAGLAVDNPDMTYFRDTLQHYIKEENYDKVQEWLDAAENYVNIRKNKIENGIEFSTSDTLVEIDDVDAQLNTITSMKQAVSKYQKAVKTEMENIAEKIYTQSINDADLDDTKTSLTKNILRNKTSNILKDKDNKDIGEYLQSDEYNQLQQGVIERIGKLNNATATQIEDFMTSVTTDTTQTFSQIEKKAKELKKLAPDTADLIEESIKAYRDIINQMLGINPDDYNKEDFGTAGGNIDLNKRPIYKNKDGSISTVNSMSFQDDDGQEVLIPTIVADENGNAKQLTDEEAIQHYKETGEFLGKFKTALEADTYAIQLHENQEKQYTTKLQQENLEGLKLSTLNLLSDAKDEMKNDESEGYNSVEFNKIYEQILNNESFLKELDRLDTSDLSEVQRFKQKYAGILGQYGADFLDTLVKNPAYDAEKAQKNLTSAQVGMKTQTSNGVAFNDISQGNTSQEDAFNELTSDAEEARRNLTLVGDELIVTGQEIADSFKESQEKAIQELENVMISAKGKIKDYQTELDALDTKGFENLNDSEKERYRLLQKNIAQERNRISVAEDLKNAYKKVSIEQDAINRNQNVITGFSAVNKEINSLKELADMYQYVGKSRMSQLDIIQAVAENTDLLTALEVNEQGQLYLTKEGIEAVAAERIGEAKSTVDAQIAKLEALKGMLNGDQLYSEYELEMLEEMATQWSNLSDDEKNALVAMAQQLGYNVTSMDQWTTFVQKDLEGARKAWNEYYKASEGKDSGSAITGSSGGGVTTQEAEKEERKTKGEQKKKEIQAEIDRLKAVSTKLGSYQKNPGSLLSDINKMGGYKSSGGGSEDKFDPVEEELEHFYNYLRKIEKIEAKLNKLAEKRNLIDANNNYYIEDLKTENELLNEQSDLYKNYIADQKSYLNELRGALQNSAYSDKVYFDKDGLVQVTQTEFTANSEEEQEALEEFMDLLNKYQNEYNTKLENENKLIQIQVQQLENVKKMYEKVLKRIQDVTTEIERQIELTEHTATMDFSEINQIDYLNTKGGQNVSGILYSETEIAKLQKEIDGINKSVKGLPYSELLEWDEALQQWNVNESKMNDPAIKAKYEALGYTWDQIETSVRSTVTSSQQLNNNLKETVSQANKFRENLKQVLEDSIAGIKDFFSNATDAINGYFSQIERAMDEIDNSNDMFGIDSESLENKYKTLVQSTVLIKQLVEELRRDQKNTENALTKDFASYVTFINGVAVMNEQAVNNSKTLTKQQQAELKRLIAAYNSAEEQIEELGDKEVEYFQKMLEMEEAKRDAIIELKQQVHDELMARDQEEIDSLQSKYEKMNQLDNEYYNKLQQRVNDARTLREDRQQGNNIAQMQARVSLLQSANGSQYNSELVELQKQLNEALQTQADNDVNRELERIQREQQERQEDRALTISAMENILTFKDENNWYWQEAQRIWSEGPESITGYLQSSREYMNISDEQRAQSFENLTTSMNTAFTTLATAEGVTAATSAGTVSNAISALDSSLTSSLNWVNQQLGSGGVIFSNLTNINGSIGQLNADLPVSFKEKMKNLYDESIKTDVESGTKAVKDYLGENSKLVTTTKSIIDSITGENGLKTATNNGFDRLYNVLIGKGEGPFSVLETVMKEMERYLSSDTSVFKYLDKEIAKKQAEEAAKNAKPVTTPPVAKPNQTPSTPKPSNPSPAPTTGPRSGNGIPEVEDTVTLRNGKFYAQSTGGGKVGNTGGSHNGETVRITQIAKNASYPIHIGTLNGGALGWLKKEQLSGYKKGGYVDYTGLANVHGTSANPEAFLNAKQTALFETLRDTLIKGANPKTYDNNKEVSKEEYNIGNVNIEVKEIAETNEIEKITKRVKEEIYRDATGHNNMAIRRR